ncbi:ATP-binding protein [Clostridium sp.]|uniref:ATP-binding protein n=1 Tax=Clostridium sp. TaxID=1506 RepID=UPI00321678A8
MKSKKISANPTKQFIVETITKDIRTEAAIYDLIDNSINAAEAINGHKILDKYAIEIKLRDSQFIINDNCGGISKDIAESDAFKIGSSMSYEKGHGIGMKRAFLKFGKKINIINNNLNYPFKVLIDVNKWGNNNNWDIDLKEVGYNMNNSNGLTIIVTNLYPSIVKTFSNPTFLSDLKKEISIKYRYKLKAGISIGINGQTIVPQAINGTKVVESPTYKTNDMSIKVILHSNAKNEPSGWDIIVNGRVVLYRDKSTKTLCRKHLFKPGCSYENFVGEVLVESNNIKKLPIWSTKDDLDFNSEAYKVILSVMYSVVDANRDKFKKSDVIIQYSKPWNSVERLKDYFDVNTAKEVGELSFDRTNIYLDKNDKIY